MKKQKAFAALLAVLVLSVLCSLAVSAGTETDDDVLLFDTEASVSYDVGGDLLAFATELRVTGAVNGSIRAFAADLTLNSRVERNVTVAGAIIECGASFSAGKVVLAGNQVLFEGTCEELVVYGGTVIIGGTVRGQLTCDASQVILLEDASLGAVTIRSGSEPVVAANRTSASYTALENSVFKEKVNFIKTRSPLQEKLISLPLSLAMSIVLALVLSFLLRSVADRISLRLHTRPAAFCLKGFGSLLVVPILAVILMLLVITLPVGGALLLVYIALLLVSKAVAAALLGRVLLARLNPYLSASLIAAVIAVLSVVPFLGGLVSFFCCLITFGAAAFLLGRRKEDPAAPTGDPAMDFRV